MKKGVTVLSFILSILVFVSLTSAACTTPDQTILKLYYTNNSHGALWNYSSYTQDICYNTLFGANYSGANPHSCTSGSANAVLKFSDMSNAHAEIFSSNTFSSPVPVCYGNLVCGNYTTCPSGSMPIVRLSGTSNAHLSIASQNPGNLYNTLICCSSVIGIANWKDMVGNIIDMKNVSVNNSVILQIQGLEPSTLTTFKIYEKTSGALTGRVFTNTTDANGRATILWKITDADMNNNARREFYFNVSGSSRGSDWNVSSLSLYANNTRYNVPPKCAIVSPTLGSVYSASQIITLSTNPNAEDVDSVITVNWKVINESNNVTEINSNNESQTYLATPGTKTIILNVTDDAGAYCYNTSAISVFAPVSSSENPKTQVFAWINYPLENQIIQAPDYKVDYSARASYAYNVTPGSCGGLVCIAGICPAVNIPCGGGSITMTGSPQTYSSLNFGWTFEGAFSSASSGLGKSNGSRVYSNSGNQIIKLALSYGTTNDIKTRKFNLMNGCEINGVNNASRVIIDPVSGLLVRYDTITTIGACESIGGSPDCCPSGGWICEEPSAGAGKRCLPPVNSAATCSDYLDQTSCTRDIYRVGNNASYNSNAPDIYTFYNCSEVVENNGHSYVVVCGETLPNKRDGCVWREDSCWLKVSLQDQQDVSLIYPQCVYKSILGECVGGYQNLTMYGESSGGSILDCASMNRNDVVLCGRTGVKLPYFGVIQFIVALLIIVLIYYLVKRGFFKKSKHIKR